MNQELFLVKFFVFVNGIVLYMLTTYSGRSEIRTFGIRIIREPDPLLIRFKKTACQKYSAMKTEGVPHGALI
jgi:hypothetical protein